MNKEKHPQLELFIADLSEVSLKDDISSMEHPIFALKAGDKNIRRYERNGVKLEIQPGFNGCATIHDKDVWIYCISQMVQAMDQGRETSRVIRFTAYDFLVTVNRNTDGRAYDQMTKALNRLAGTRLETNIKTDEKKERAGFGLIDGWRVIEKFNERMVAVEVTLPDWLYRSILSKQVLTLNRDYFKLRKPLHRRIYELARKHCGKQAKWNVSIATLYQKSGSRAAIKRFRFDMKKLILVDVLPGYRMVYNPENDVVTFYIRNKKGARAQIKDMAK